MIIMSDTKIVLTIKEDAKIIDVARMITLEEFMVIEEVDYRVD